MGNRVKRYERFGEVIRYLTIEELKLFFDSIDNYKRKLMFEVMYELGCRVGEFVRIQIKHINLGRSAIFFPAQNTKTKYARLSYLPPGLTNEIKSMLKQQKLMTKPDDRIRNADAYLFRPGRRWNTSYTENRIRQLFQQYVSRAGLQQIYGVDSLGRNLRMFTVHSLRHSHVMHYAVDRGVALPIVQKQVGHRSLKTTSVYLSPSAEKIGMAYRTARQQTENEMDATQSFKYHVSQWIGGRTWPELRPIVEICLPLILAQKRRFLVHRLQYRLWGHGIMEFYSSLATFQSIIE